MKVGGVSTLAYTSLKADNYTYLLNLIRPKVVVVDDTTVERVRLACEGMKYPKALLVAGESVARPRQREFSLSDMIETADGRLEVEPTHRDDIAFWNFTSGTTGKPKGVPHMHRDTVLSYESFQYVLKYSPDDIVLRVPKLFFHYARDNGALFALRSGAAVVLYEERATPELIFDLVKKYRPTVLINVPTMMRAMIHLPKHQWADLSCLRYTMSSGELLSARLYEEWVSTFGVEVIDRFGSAELGVAYLCNRFGAVMPGSSGLVTPLVEIKLVDGDGVEVPVGQPGVLMVRSDSSAQSYVREHEKSKLTFPGDEWINTGDLFRQDDKGYFWHMGRADDMVKVSGIWVSPQEIEQCIQTWPTVKECAALGVNDKDGLTMIKAFVVLKDGAIPAADEPEQVKRYCKTKLDPRKYPAVLEIIHDLPKTGQGKIDRRLLRRL